MNEKATRYNIHNRREHENGMIDYDSIAVIPEEREHLKFGDDVLFEMTKEWSGPVVAAVPGFRYWECGANRKMCDPNNITGHQQRAFDFYWAIKEGVQKGRAILGVGTTNVAGPCVIGTDKYFGDKTPNEERYGVSYDYPHMEMDADKQFPFFDNKFGVVQSNHVLEHVENIEFTVYEMLRVTQQGGVVTLVMPDMSYSDRGSLDPTHTREFGSDEFFILLKELMEEKEFIPFYIEEHNTLRNHFSFNTVLRKL